MKKVSKKLQKYIDSISIIGDSNLQDDEGKIYYSKVDGAYLTRVGMENDLKFMLKKGISEQIQDGNEKSMTCSIGFNPKEQKWYGWSHRAIFGFGIGSQCKKESCGYLARNKKDFAASCLAFWKGKYSIGDDKVEIGEFISYDGSKNVKGVWVTYTYNNKVRNKKIRGTKFTRFTEFPGKWGRGEWTAKTIDEAKIMAIDFAKGVS